MAQRLTTSAYLYQQLQKARRYDEAIRQQVQGGELFQTNITGKVIAGAYEQLRNATELQDGNITLRRAIRRFYKRALFIAHIPPERVGRELIIELVQSGYVQEGVFGENAAHIITSLVTEHAEIYRGLRAARISQQQAINWTLAVLSVRTYDLLLPHTHDLVVNAYTYEYFRTELPREKLTDSSDEDGIYDDALYVAAHQALLQSDIDAVRTDLLQKHGTDGTHVDEYIRWNRYADQLYTAPLTLRLKRTVSRNGAPFRVLRSLVAGDQRDEILLDRGAFAQAYQYQIASDYRKVNQRLNSGVIKSITFLFLTKVLIGLGVEAPFDRYMYGHLIVVPLTVNLLFPPLYMASIRLGLSVPSHANALATAEFMDKLLYADVPPQPKLLRGPSRTAGAQIGYGIFFLIPFAITYLILRTIGFNPLQMVIFLVFFSTASFLGYRLSLMVRELRITSSDSGVAVMLRDLFYLPYIVVGQWLSSKYAAVNVIGETLDLIIELPLKTVLSLVRQWIHFLREKHEELY